MAPEQFHGKAVFASDIYSLGVTMYQMLTGVLPYDTPSPADLDRLMRGELLSRAAAEEPEDPQGDQRHRPEGDGARDSRALPARRRSARRRAGRARQRAAADAARRAAIGDRDGRRATRRTSRRALKAREAPPAALLLALPQAAARPLRPLPVLRRSAVSDHSTSRPARQRYTGIRCARMTSGAHGFSGHRQDLDERQARRLEGREHSHRVARHPLRQRRLRRRALLRTRRRAPPASGSTRTCAGCSTPPRSTGWSTRSTSPAGTNAVLETIRANEMKACYIRPIVYRGYDTLGVNPLPSPVDAAIMLWEWGAYLGQDALEQGVDVQGQLVVAHGAEHAAGDGQERGQLRQLRADQDGSDRRRLLRRASRSTSPATSAKAAARTSSSCATASIYTPPLGSSILGGITRDSIMTLARDLGFTVTETMHAARGALHRRRGVLRRHGRRGDADPVGRQDHDRQRPPRPDHRSAAAARSSTSSTARCPIRTAG